LGPTFAAALAPAPGLRHHLAMPSRHLLFVSTLALALGARLGATEAGVCAFVDPFIGTADGGQVYPGPAAPFGLIHLSPDTGELPGGYDWSQARLRGFSLTHLNGIGCVHGEDFRFIPLAAPPAVSPRSEAFPSWPLDHSKESAAPGSYDVALEGGLRVELAAGPRTAIARLSFGPGQQPILCFDAGSNAAGVLRCALAFDPARRLVTGWARSRGVCGSPQAGTVWFAAELDQPFSVGGLWLGTKARPGLAALEGFNVSGWLRLQGGASSVRVRMAISRVDAAGALANLTAEAPGWDAAALASRTRAAWESLLGQVRVQGGRSGQRRLLYTALYRVFLQPGLGSDADRRYLGLDQRVHRLAQGQAQYQDYSMWDTYRDQALWLDWLAPQQAGQIAASLLRDAADEGHLPLWSYGSASVATMLPYPAAPYLAGLQAFGARGFDAGKVLDLSRAALKAGGDGPGRWWGGPLWAKQGWLPASSGVPSPLAASLESVAAAGGLAALAQRLGRGKDAAYWAGLAGHWRDCVDPANGLPRLKNPDGSWASSSDPGETAGLIEGCAAQYAWCVPQDLGGLIAATGGPAAARERLDHLFGAVLGTGWHPEEPFFWAGNEIDLGAPWVWDWLGEPDKARACLAQVLEEAWNDGPAGWPGNDDSGAMAAWAADALLGFYPEAPGVAGLALHEPFFDGVEIGPAPRPWLRIRRAPADSGPRGPWLEGKALPSAWWSVGALQGGHFELEWRDRGAPLQPPPALLPAPGPRPAS
jgi:predicted alpha-1,2-mannosidase